MSKSEDRHQLNVQFTDRHYGFDLMHDCLYYNVLDDLLDYTPGWYGLSQIIPFCIRSESDEMLISAPLNVNGTSHTFDELRLTQITSEQLYGWSAPSDLTERYQLYLDNPNELLSNETFHNCSRPWFGQFCQFKFDEDRSLSDIIKLSFLSKVEQSAHMFEVTNSTCYVHLNCYVGPEPLCLDWRDICDGKIDCMDGNNDERDCLELEMNVCSENEFQCHNGQCIPFAFFQNDRTNPDCMDGSDEWGRFVCDEDPTMRCEDRSSALGYVPYVRGIAFNCGNGESNSIGDTGRCSNKRSDLFDRIIFSESNNPLLTFECWSAIVNYLKITEYVGISTNQSSPCYKANKHCSKFIFDNCPPLFPFPSLPALFGHVYLYYSHNQSINKSLTDRSPAKPMYVCYNDQLCPFMPWNTKINESNCRPFHELSQKSGWFDVIKELVNMFWSCSTNDIAKENCQNGRFYQCENTSKCISNRRLTDGFIDCFDGSDERTNDSCSVDDDLRFACTSEDKCISHLTYQDGIKDCLGGEDEQRDEDLTESEPTPSFATMCDGFIEINLDEYVRNRSTETDETNCDQWPCSNIYTRCDGFWNCKNGSDELNCPKLYSRCTSDEFECVSVETFEFICLNATRAGDGHVDCLGGSDERSYCRNDSPDDSLIRYRCWNSTKCISVYSMCSDRKECPFRDHKKFCDRKTGVFGICDEYDWDPELERHPSRHFLCELEESSKLDTVRFALTEYGQQSVIHSTNAFETSVHFRSFHNYNTGSLNVAWLCNRGLFVWRWIEEELTRYCLCPPAYYGHRCQLQSQRISLSYRVYTIEWLTVFNFAIMLIDDASQIHSYEQRIYHAVHDCDIQFGMNLLYYSRPKDISKNYTVRIDLFNKFDLSYRTTWEFPLRFSFLPVYRLATNLTIPIEPSTTSKDCSPRCIHGECLLYTNTRRAFCRCFQGWFGSSCERVHHCDCAKGSVCIVSANNNTVCVCPLGKNGARCLLTRSSCIPNPCLNGGLCVPADERIAERSFSCICKQGYTGVQCQHQESSIEILFSDMPIPASVFIHFITIVTNASSLRTTMVKKIAFDQDSVSLFQSSEYHIILVQCSGYYYLAYVEPRFESSASLTLPLASSHRCSSVDKLFDSTIIGLPLIRRMKYYHIPCRERDDLNCFYDEVHMCLCSKERHANCLEFDHNMTYDCQGSNYCQNGAHCFQNHPTCPSSMTCACDECFYGSRCQFNTKGFGLSLDVILGYQIRPHISFRRQSIAVKVSASITMIMLLLGLINATISIMTFQSVNSREFGCGVYLLFSSIISIFTITTFTLKFWLVVLAQKRAITNQSYLSFNCVTVDILLQVFLSFNEWLNAAVTVERAVTAMRGVQLNKVKTKRVAKVVIPILFVFIILTNIHDPLNRHLIDDIEEQRTWCSVSYSNNVQLFDSIAKVFHFLAPFLLNLVSAVIIIIRISRNQFVVKKQKFYTEHLREQLRRHQHLLISPVILIILHLPRFLITLISGCMKSARNPWIFLAGYFVSCVPSLLTFIIFVLPSDMYKKEFAEVMRQKQMTIKRWLSLEQSR